MKDNEFNKASKLAKKMSREAFVKAILDERPDLKALVKSGQVTPKFPGMGNSAYTVIIGNEVFKTAQSEGWAPTGITSADLVLGIERERDLLGFLNDKDLMVPRLTHVGKNFLFFGMSMLGGDVLTRYDVEAMQPDDKRKVAKQVAEFYVGLSQAVPVEDAKRMNLDVSPAEWSFDPKQLYAEFSSNQRVREAFGERYDFFKAAIEGYIGYHEQKTADNGQYLMHCDMKDGNLLWNPATRDLTGVIDFGLSHLTGIESGFKKLCEKYPADFADMVMEEYSSRQHVNVTRKEVQQWACVEYVSYVLDELKAHKGHVALRDYNEFVRSPLQLKPSAVSPAQLQQPSPYDFAFK